MDNRQRLLARQAQQAYQRRTAALRSKLDGLVAAQWNRLESWRDPDIVTFQNRVLPALDAAERQMVDLTNAYVTTVDNLAGAGGGRTPAVDYREVTGPALRNGADLTEVWRRPQMALNYALSEGATVTAAVTAGLGRARSLASTNLQLAKTHTVAKTGKREWYRRVLTGSENCTLCVIASTQRYRRGNLMPIHPGCDCGVQSEQSVADPGWVINRDLLDLVHVTVATEMGKTDFSARIIDGLNDRSDFLDLMVTRDHGELGPVLAWRDQHFRNAADVAAAA